MCTTPRTSEISEAHFAHEQGRPDLPWAIWPTQVNPNESPLPRQWLELDHHQESFWLSLQARFVSENKSSWKQGSIASFVVKRPRRRALVTLSGPLPVGRAPKAGSAPRRRPLRGFMLWLLTGRVIYTPPPPSLSRSFPFTHAVNLPSCHPGIIVKMSNQLLCH